MPEKSIDFPRDVEVTFHVPGIGAVKERYDLLTANDMACWHVNASTYPQINVTPGTTMLRVPVRRLAAFHRLLRLRDGKRHGLSLRKKV